MSIAYHIAIATIPTIVFFLKYPIERPAVEFFDKWMILTLLCGDIPLLCYYSGAFASFNADKNNADMYNIYVPPLVLNGMLMMIKPLFHMLKWLYRVQKKTKNDEFYRRVHRPVSVGGGGGDRDTENGTPDPDD